MALQAKPNAGHYALTELSKKLPDFITLTQNVDGELLSIHDRLHERDIT